jgi:hypothetical protein
VTAKKQSFSMERHVELMEYASNLEREVERLQKIIDSRPAINAALPESYIKWSQSIYTMEAVHALGIDRN